MDLALGGLFVGRAGRVCTADKPDGLKRPDCSPHLVLCEAEIRPIGEFAAIERKGVNDLGGRGVKPRDEYSESIGRLPVLERRQGGREAVTDGVW
jgi:hypothetical protein